MSPTDVLRSTRIEGPTILVVDDDPANLSLLSDYLREFGHRVIVARDGESALEKARFGCPDLILLDLLMPKLDGYQTCLMLKADEALRDIPIIFMTALTATADKVRAFQAGGVDYITKPFQHEEILARVTTHLSLRAMRRQLEAQNEQLQRENAERRQVEEALRAARDGLERRVAERTAELSQAILSLREENSVRRRTEEELRSSEERYRALYDDNPSMYFTVDQTGMVLSVNEFGARQLGYQASELAGRPVSRVFLEEDQALAAELLLRCVDRHGQVFHWELRKIRKDGSLLWVKETARAVTRADGRTVVLVVCEDITDRKQSEEERTKLEARLLQAQKLESVGLLAGGIAHDFNNLLTPILGYTDFLVADLAPSDPRVQDVQVIKQAAERAQDLVRQLLAFGRRQMLALKTLSLGEVLRRFEPMLRRVIREDIRIEIITSSHGETVRADVGQMEQVLMNLAVNAQDAMPRGGALTIQTCEVVLDETAVREDPELKPGPYVMLTVSDTGSGIDAATQPHVFEPFFTTKERGKGTGLGLPTVYGIVRQHGGSISLSSALGQGSTFRIYLPCLDPSSAPTDGDAPSRSRSPLGGTETILVVDDDQMVRDVACRLLRRLGYQVLAPENLESCVALAEKHPGTIDLLLTDVVLPSVDGKEIFRQLRESRPALKVLYMSGYTSEVIVHHGALDPGVSFIPKPLTLRDLSEGVRKALGHRG